MARDFRGRHGARARIFVACAFLILCVPALASDEVRIRVRDAAGFAGGGVTVDITMDAEPKPSAIGFWLEFDATRLTMTNAIPGAVVTLAGKDVSWDFPAPGRVSFLIYGLNDTRISSGKILSVTFNIDEDAEPNDEFEIHGLNASATEPDATSIPTEIEDGEIDVLQCFEPAAPANFVATDGIFGDHVQLSWLPVFGAQSYVVLRSTVNDSSTASILAVTVLPFYSDFSATGASFVSTGGGGCSGSSGQSLRYTEYYYWVQAQNICGESDFTAAESGWRGKSETSVKSGTSVDALPAIADETTSQVALRLSSESAIDAASIVANVDGALAVIDVAWQAVDTSGSDGWVTVTLSRALEAGESITVHVGAQTQNGELAGPAIHTFTCAAPIEAVSSPIAAKFGETISVVPVTASALPDFIESMGARYSVYPALPFDGAQRISIPVAEGVEPSEMAPHLYVEGTGWCPAGLVDGWVVPGSISVSTIGGVPCVTFDAHFGGIVQLGYASAPVPDSRTANWAGGLPMAVAAVALFLAAIRRKSAPRTS